MLDVVQKGYKLGDRVVRPARVVVAARRRAAQEEPRAMAESLYDTLGVEEGRLGRRDQEGVPEARTPVPPGHEPGRQGRRGALQGGAGGLRRPLRRREAEGVRPLRLDERPRARPAAARTSTSATSTGAATSATSSATSSAGRGARRGRAPQPVRGADVETEVRLSFEDSLRGAEAKVPVELDGRLLGVRRHRRASRARLRSSAPSATAAASRPRARACSRSRSPARAAAATAP